VSRFFIACSLPHADDRTAALRSTVSGARAVYRHPINKNAPANRGV
jgi:hypothetical protein